MRGIGSKCHFISPERTSKARTEPAGAALLMGKEWHPHKIQGWTPDFIPYVLQESIDKKYFDDLIPVAGADGIDRDVDEWLEGERCGRVVGLGLDRDHRHVARGQLGLRAGTLSRGRGFFVSATRRSEAFSDSNDGNCRTAKTNGNQAATNVVNNSKSSRRKLNQRRRSLPAGFLPDSSTV